MDSGIRPRFLHLAKRFMTYNQAISSLKPLLLAVHPDFFQQYPKYKLINQASLQKLHLLLNDLSRGNEFDLPSKSYLKQVKPSYSSVSYHCELEFYFKGNSKSALDDKKILTIILQPGSRHSVASVKDAVEQVLEQYFMLSGAKNDSSPMATKRNVGPQKNLFNTLSMGNIKFGDELNFSSAFSGFAAQSRAREEVVDSVTSLTEWLESSIYKARKLADRQAEINANISRLRSLICNKTGLSSIAWESDWASNSFISCLQSFNNVLNLQPADTRRRFYAMLRDRHLIFTNRSGTNVSGDFLLNCSDVPENWTSVIETCSLDLDETLAGIERHERMLSILLHGVQITRSNLKLVTCYDYMEELRRLVTHLCNFYQRIYKSRLLRKSLKYDYLHKTNLSHLKLIVEDSMGSLFVTRDKRVVCPSLTPVFLLLEFLFDVHSGSGTVSESEDACQEVEHLRELCVQKHNLLHLAVNANVSSSEAVVGLHSLLRVARSESLDMSDLVVTISKYYSVLSTGEICIPWNP